MKNIAHPTPKNWVRLAAVLLCTGSLGGSSLLAEGATNDSKPANTPISQDEPIYNNWMDLSFGGQISKGNQAEFLSQHPTNGPVYGGIDDMHVEETLWGKTLVNLDAHAIFADSDYRLKLELTQLGLGYIKAGFTEFCTYSTGNGISLPSNPMIPSGMFYAGPEFALYRSSIWAEFGLRMENLPELTLRYEHDSRYGQEDSTSYGSMTTPFSSAYSSTRKIVPSFWNINETQDIFTFKAKQTLGKPETYGNTDVNLGMRYELDKTDDSLNWYNNPGAAPTAVAFNTKNVPLPAASYAVTQSQQLTLPIYNGNLSTETHLGDKLWLTTGYSYSTGSSVIGGSQIAGPTYNSGFTPYNGNLAYGGIPSGAFINLGGGANMIQSSACVNLLWTPTDWLTVSPSGRYECDSTTASSYYLTEVGQTTKAGTGPTVTKKGAKVTITPLVPASITTPAGLQPLGPTFDNSTDFINNFTEGLQIRCTKFKNWVLYAEGDWNQQDENRGDQTLNQGYNPAGSHLNLNSIISSLAQNYQVGANWYPLSHLNASIQYNRQLQNNTQNIMSEDPSRANQRMLTQNWTTDDGNVRVTWQALPTLSLVTRFDVTRTLINGSFASDPATPGFQTPSGQCSIMNNRMITEGLTWSPLDRLYINGDFSYVVNQTTSPATSQTPSVLSANNNYWTLDGGLGYAIDSKTEIRADVSYYSADNYQNNEMYGVPYGAGGTQTTFSASLKRQISRNVSMTLKYYIDRYTDQLSGGNNNYLVQMISTGLQVRF